MLSHYLQVILVQQKRLVSKRFLFVFINSHIQVQKDTICTGKVTLFTSFGNHQKLINDTQTEVTQIYHYNSQKLFQSFH